MKKIPLISSAQNPLVKEVLELQSKSRARQKYRKFIVEGLNELRLCLAAGYEAENIIFCEENVSPNDLEAELNAGNLHHKLVSVSSEVFAKIAYRKDVRNAVAMVAMKEPLSEQISIGEHALILVAEGIEKPGNIGAILRSADAMGVDALILADPRCDLYNPNVIRSSVGCVFTVPVLVCSNNEALHYLNANEFSIFTTFMESASQSWDISFPSRTALVVGTESTGLTDFWKRPEHKNVNIPMFGKVDSLNVSVAVSLLLYEAKRQSKENK